MDAVIPCVPRWLPRHGPRLLRVLVLAWALAQAGALEAPPPAPAALVLPPHLEPGAPLATVSSALRPYLVTAAPTAGATSSTGSSAIAPALRALAGLDAHATTVPLRLDCRVDARTLADLAAIGVTIREVAARWQSIRIDATMAQIPLVAQLPEVHAVVLVRPPRHAGQPGTYSNQAAGVLHTDLLQQISGTTGAGRTLGVISDSINATSAVGSGVSSGASPPFQLSQTRPQLAGNLPPVVQVLNYGSAAEGATDEGEAMLEECYHLAPGAGYAFSATGGSQTAMASTISALGTACGCSVVCDDVLFLDEPMFQDGPIAQAAAAFVAAGGTYLAAAGNDADAGIIMPFALDAAAGLHDWGSGLGDYLPITVSAGGSLTIVLQWSQPFASFGLGAGAQTDLDLALYALAGAAPSQLIASSSDTQGTIGAPSGDPVEILQYTNATAATQSYDLAIPYRHGATGITLRLVASVAHGTFGSTAYGRFGSGTIYGHAAASAVLAIGAAAWTTPSVLEAYSGKGGWGASGLPVFFDTAGTPLPAAPQLRDKPDLVGVDGVHTSSFGTVLSGDASGLPSFFGTSAAVANAAAAAELIWCAHPALASSGLRGVLAGSASDLTAYPAVSGPDAWSGSGLINAQAAAGPVVVEVSSHTANGTYRSGTITLQLTFDRPVVVDASGGLPTISLNPSAGALARYSGGSGSGQLLFTYTISPGDVAATLDVASAGALELNGGHITASAADASAAVLALPAPGQAGSLSVNTQIAISAIGPTVAITPTPPTSNQPVFTFTIVFSHPALGFTLADCTIANGQVQPGSFTALPDGVSYQVVVTAASLGPVTLSVSAGVVQDSDGYANAAGVGTATYDITPPTVVVTTTPTTITAGMPLVITFTWSKPVVFVAGDVVLSGVEPGSGALSGSGALYTLAVQSGPPGVLGITIPAGAVSDLAGNRLAQASQTEITIHPAAGGGGGGCGVGDGLGLVLGVLLVAGARSWRGGQARISAQRRRGA